jgi:hypothetical protein
VSEDSFHLDAGIEHGDGPWGCPRGVLGLSRGLAGAILVTSSSKQHCLNMPCTQHTHYA